MNKTSQTKVNIFESEDLDKVYKAPTLKPES